MSEKLAYSTKFVTRIININSTSDAREWAIKAMYEDYENGDHTGQLTERQKSLAETESSTIKRRTMNRWQFQADQVQMLHQQIQIELIISLLFSVIVISVLWDNTPRALLIGWAVAVIVSIGVRSLLISENPNGSNVEDVNAWGQQYITGVTVSGICWGSLEIISLIYGELIQQIFVLVVLSGISLTVFVSMQSLPKAISAFVIPTLLPASAWFFYQGTVLSLALGAATVIMTTVMLITSRTMRDNLAKSFNLTLGSIGDGVITTELNGDIEYMNMVAEQSTGWKLQDARGKPMRKIFKLIEERSLDSPPDPAALCLEKGKSTILAGHLLLLHRYNNKRLSVEVNASPIRDSNADITGVVLVFHDVTELRGLAKKMSYQATHDSLTGLLNRREFENRVEQAINNARTENIRHAICYVDLDNFKVVNDTCGHFAGDELLKQLTIKLRMELREADTLARLGGDEFGILLEDCSIDNAREPAEAIRKIVEEFRFVWENTSFRIGASIGLVPITHESGTLTEILSAADSACYVAKDLGRNRVHIYKPDDKALSERHGQMQWVQRIQEVLEQNRFRLFFQPIVKLNRAADEKILTHGEVLIRMLDENNKIIGPGSFIPAAERFQLMPAIDRWVVTNTFRMLTLDKKKVADCVSSCCINLSGQSLSDERFMEFLVNEIKDSGVSPEILVFEITETAVIANLCNASTLITTLRDMGCRLALDDFGVGLSSFGYLKSLAVDYLKLDGCFVKNMVRDNIDHAIVQAINQIGHTMDIKTIAEFVEDEATLEAVRSVGIDYAQGYVIAKPMPIEIALYNDPIDLAASEDQPALVQIKTALARG